MRKVRIKSLSESEISRAINEVQAYKKDLIRKAGLFREKLAEEVQSDAQDRFNSSAIDSLVGGRSRGSSVKVSVDPGSGKITTVIASGEDAVWVEFGAGVHFNGSVGSSPHPDGTSLGMIIGGYGKGNGKREVWGFYDDEKNFVLTYGTKATMPMYNALKDVAGRIAEIAEEVFR